MDDLFSGNDAKLIEAINALLSLDAAGSLKPHGVGKFARVLLSSAAHRLARPDPAPRDGLCETIVWIPVTDRLPDAELTVNVTMVPNTSGEPVWLGHFDGERWLDVEGGEIEVSHWTPMLEGAKV